MVFAGGGAEVLEIALDGKNASEPERRFIDKILSAAEQNKTEIDEKISVRLVGWTMERLNKTDLAVLRTAVAEMLLGEVPVPVIINEATAIAKKYGGAESGAFVNGILARITE
jgi:N utilization substance protein B